MTDRPSILFIHNNFPAQFGYLGLWLAQRGWDVTFATGAQDVTAPPSLRILPYKPHREPAPQVHPYAQPMEKAALHAQAFVRSALPARKAGLRPDVIVGHAGWGPGLCARDVFPEAAYVSYCEWWYRHPGADVVFLDRIRGEPADRPVEAPMLERMRNAPIALEIAGSDAVLCPTAFQAAQFPDALRARMRIEHDGIDTGLHAPDPALAGSTLDGLLPEGARLVTYATRGMEPHRGFPQVMAALPEILASDPSAVAVIAGENRVAYGGSKFRKTDWKAEALRTHDLDPARVKFVGRLERTDYVRLLQRSDAHVYLTVPFVLSWSMLEAMAVGCALVLSDTDPVREFADENCARLVDMGDPQDIAAAVLATLADPARNAARRVEARARILARVPQEACFARKETMFRDLIAGGGSRF